MKVTYPPPQPLSLHDGLKQNNDRATATENPAPPKVTRQEHKKNQAETATLGLRHNLM